MSAKPTPTPWEEDGMQIYDAEGRIIASVAGSDFTVDEEGQNAAFIKRCVNAMPAVVKALDGLFNAIDSSVELTPELMRKARAALALAKWESQ